MPRWISELTEIPEPGGWQGLAPLPDAGQAGAHLRTHQREPILTNLRSQFSFLRPLPVPVSCRPSPPALQRLIPGLEPCCLYRIYVPLMKAGACEHAELLSHVRLFVTPWTISHQAPLSMGFSRQEYWSGLPCPPPGDLLNPGIKPASLTSPALAGVFFTTWQGVLLRAADKHQRGNRD